MRIIAGKARGHKLIPPATMETRPTLDRVKEAMFSSIQSYIQDAVVVDVFSGTGSLGLESASRGASEVYLFDKSSVTFPLLKQNVEKLRFEDFCFPINTDAYAGLRQLASKGKKFDIIFIDPPYCKEMIPEAMKIVKEHDLLKEDGIIVTKIDTIEEVYDGYKDIKLNKSKKYGNTTVCYYKYEEK
ncbi:MAG: 16S rRNA (guanine(966)-N(2))-methyltransferase RsmD [Clostridium sp.]|uniref:16S rRNA (guanine(966)-N(2))-methyltransferase RsmD n=1 Tax=Clostridium sp. TaxID=1506 RepID=UPI0025BB6871|nr:16S rRNA (guanine(966)-N(2))-methyltransferase RsmD [Clostridium sp.]MCE5220430.1 16S rRNA (guanine(966)-N(2))-methyltransferase RsmD [Clostridium sp.]